MMVRKIQSSYVRRYYWKANKYKLEAVKKGVAK